MNISQKYAKPRLRVKVRRHLDLDITSSPQLTSFARLCIVWMALAQSSSVEGAPVSSLWTRAFKARDASARRALSGMEKLIESKKSQLHCIERGGCQLAF
jgi:hypothetical protein